MRLKPFETARPTSSPARSAYICSWDPSRPVRGGPTWPRTPSKVSTSSAGSPSGSRGRRSASTGPAATSPAGRRRGRPQRDRRREHRRRVPRRRPRQQRELQHPARRAQAADADVPELRAVPRRQLVGRLPDPRPRVHPRPVEPAGRELQQPLDAATATRPAAWARGGATSTRSSTWSPASYATNTDAPGELTPRPLPRQERGGLPAPRRLTAGSARPPPTACSSSPATPAATPTTTWATASSAPRCTPPARRGRRRCGTSARSSATGSRWRSSPRACGCRPTTRRCSTCATRSSLPTRRSTAGPTTIPLWNRFADRGFGFYAGSDGGADAAPVADFNTPPPPGTPTGSDRRHRHRPGRRPAAGRRGQDRRAQRVLRHRRRQRRVRDHRRAVRARGPRWSRPSPATSPTPRP